METPIVLILPQYAKMALTLLSLCLITIILYLGQNILIPLLLSLLFAILLRPVVIFFTLRCKFPHIIAVFVAVFIFVVVVAAILLFISWQVSDITEDWHKIKTNIFIHYKNIRLWVREHFHISYFKQQNYLNKVTEETINGESNIMGNTLNSFSDTFLDLILIPIYTFLILLYRNLFIKFLYKVVGHKNETTLVDILGQVKSVIQSYIIGLLFEMAIVGILTTAGLMFLGVPYAILLGLITAILNLIPYIGILVAALISILATLVNSAELSIILGVIVLNVVVQFIDNNLIVPRVVGNKVRINALVSIVGVIVGGSISGIPGMILSIPLLAILKVIFDNIKPMRAWGLLLGNFVPKDESFI